MSTNSKRYASAYYKKNRDKILEQRRRENARRAAVRAAFRAENPLPFQVREQYIVEHTPPVWTSSAQLYEIAVSEWGTIDKRKFLQILARLRKRKAVAFYAEPIGNGQSAYYYRRKK